MAKITFPQVFGKPKPPRRPKPSRRLARVAFPPHPGAHECVCASHAARGSYLPCANPAPTQLPRPQARRASAYPLRATPNQLHRAFPPRRHSADLPVINLCSKPLSANASLYPRKVVSSISAAASGILNTAAPFLRKCIIPASTAPENAPAPIGQHPHTDSPPQPAYQSSSELMHSKYKEASPSPCA